MRRPEVSFRATIRKENALVPMKPTSSLVEPLMIRRRRWTAVLALPMALVVAVSGLWFAYATYSSIDGGLGIALAALGVVGFLGAASVARHSWKGVTQEEPVLVLDGDGVTDDFHHHMFLPWSDIQSATVDYGDGDSLVITLQEGASLPNGRIVHRSFTRMAKRAFNGGDLAIPLGSLSVDYRQLKRSLDYNIQRAAHGQGASRASRDPK